MIGQAPYEEGRMVINKNLCVIQMCISGKTLQATLEHLRDTARNTSV